MSYFANTSSAIALFSILCVPLDGAHAQDSLHVGVSASEAFRPIPRGQRPTLAIRSFDFSAQLSRDDQADLNSYASVIYAFRGGTPRAQAETNSNNLAKATTQLLSERLQNTGQFRVFEREQLDAVTGEQDLAASSRARQGQSSARTGELRAARYVVTGAITKFGKSKKRKGGMIGSILGRVGGGVGMSASQTDYEVGLTVKVIESSTGEVIASATTEAVAAGDTERSLSGIGGTWGAVAGGAFSKSATGEREKRISEALQRAIDLVVLQLVSARKGGAIEP